MDGQVTGYILTMRPFGSLRNKVTFWTMCTVAVWPLTTPFFLSRFCVISTRIPLKRFTGGILASHCTRMRGVSSLNPLSVAVWLICVEACP